MKRILIGAVLLLVALGVGAQFITGGPGTPASAISGVLAAANGGTGFANTGTVQIIGSPVLCYKTGTFVPTLNSITQVGSPTNSATFVRIGTTVKFRVILSAATSTAATAGTGNITGLPYAVSVDDALVVASNDATNIGLGSGSVLASTSAVYPPTISVGAGITVIVGGVYETSAACA